MLSWFWQRVFRVRLFQQWHVNRWNCCVDWVCNKPSCSYPFARWLVASSRHYFTFFFCSGFTMTTALCIEGTTDSAIFIVDGYTGDSDSIEFLCGDEWVISLVWASQAKYEAKRPNIFTVVSFFNLPFFDLPPFVSPFVITLCVFLYHFFWPCKCSKDVEQSVWCAIRDGSLARRFSTIQRE